MRVQFDFSAPKKIKRQILDKIDDVIEYEHDRGLIQKYRTENHAWFVWRFVECELPGFFPGPPPFEINGSWYVCWLPRGKSLLALCKGDLFESQIMYDGKSEVLFITDYYRGIIRDLIVFLYLVKDKNIRYRMDLKHVYTNIFTCFFNGFIQYNANFTRFDVQEVMNNELDLLIDIKRLFGEINDKWCNTGSYKAEFDLLLKNLSLKEHPNKVLDNVICWTKAGRVKFLKRVLEFSNTCSILLFDIHTSAVVETFSGFTADDPRKVFFSKWIKLLHKKFPLRMSSDKCVRYLIEVIVHVYDSLADDTGSSKECIHHVGEVDANSSSIIEFKDGDQFVEFIQYTFPTLIGGLAERVKKENWPLGMKIEEFVAKDMSIDGMEL